MRVLSAALIAALIAIGAFAASASAATSDGCNTDSSVSSSRVTCDPGPICGPIAGSTTRSIQCPGNPCSSPVLDFGNSRVPALGGCDQPCPPPEPVTDPATNVSGSSAILNGHVLSWGADTHWYFAYGPNSTNLPFSTPIMTVDNGAQTLSAPVSGLSPGTTYFQLVVIGCSTPQYGQILSLALPKQPDDAPAVSGDSAPSGDTSAGVTQSAPAISTTASSTVVKQSIARVTVTKKATKKTKKARKHKKAKKAKRASRHH